jgi:NADPH2:quinone reductase
VPSTVSVTRSPSQRALPVPGGFFGSAFVLGTPEFPLAAIPLQDMIAKAEAGTYQAGPARVLGFGELAEAHRIMEAGTAGGKMVATVD